MTTGDMSNQASSPPAQPVRLRLAHATEEGNHRIDQIARDVENSHVLHVLSIPATHDKNVPSRLHYVITESANCRMNVERCPAIHNTVGEVVNRRLSRSWVNFRRVRLKSHLFGGLTRPFVW